MNTMESCEGVLLCHREREGLSTYNKGERNSASGCD